MKVTKVKKQGESLKVFLDDDRDFIIPYLPTTFLYTETKAYLDGGGVIEAEFTEAEIIEQQAQAINSAIQNHLDTQAKSLRYDNINAIGKYVGYANDFQAEAEALGAWASSCWLVAGQIEADVQAGVRTMPTVDEVLAELPVYGG